MALSLTLGAVSAEEAAADAAAEPAADVVAVEEAPAAEGNAAGGDAAAVAADVPVADVAVDVEALNETDELILWSVKAINYGPDTAYSTVAKVAGSDNMAIVYSLAEAGSFDKDLGLWNIGDIPAGVSTTLYLITAKIFEGPYYVEAYAMPLLSYDPDLTNNYDIAWVGLDAAASEETTTLPETGNPLAMALLALLAIGIGGIKRRF